MDDNCKCIGAIWDEKTKRGHGVRSRWYQCPEVVAHIQRKIGGTLAEFVHKETNTTKFLRAISVGCGTATKEVRLLEAGVVEFFDLYELSRERIEIGQRYVESKGLQDRVAFHLADAFQEPIDDSTYDMVYWDNSLHHMMDANDALLWSRRILKDDGVIFIYDFVGPSRFQWTDFNIMLANEFRKTLPKRYFLRPDGKTYQAVRIGRRSVDRCIELDPSEAADSGNILPCFAQIFPNSKVVLTGGAIYQIALAGIYQNFDFNKKFDRQILKYALLIDDLAIHMGVNHYAAAIGWKKGSF